MSIIFTQTHIWTKIHTQTALQKGKNYFDLYILTEYCF